MAYQFDALAPEYASAWDRMRFQDAKRTAIANVAKRLMGYMQRYDLVEAATGVPASLIAVIHSRESDADFNTHLHNGDPLSQRTYHVPAGRPIIGDPPFKWEESATDALRYEGLTGLKWSIEMACFALEKYNGWGYRQYHDEASPYLWAGSNVQEAGKYTADGKFNRSAFDTQLGCMPVLMALWAMDSTLSLPRYNAPVAIKPQPDEHPAPLPKVLPDPVIPPPRPPDDPGVSEPPSGGFLLRLWRFLTTGEWK